MLFDHWLDQNPIFPRPILFQLQNANITVFCKLRIAHCRISENFVVWFVVVWGLGFLWLVVFSGFFFWGFFICCLVGGGFGCFYQKKI